MDFASFIQSHYWLIILTILWVLPWKGAALWRAAKRGDLAWFVVMLVLNTFAGLEILYIFIFSQKEKGAKKK